MEGRGCQGAKEIRRGNKVRRADGAPYRESARGRVYATASAIGAIPVGRGIATPQRKSEAPPPAGDGAK